MITLTYKDADWIANFIREELISYKDVYEDAKKEAAEAYKEALEHCKKLGVSPDTEVDGLSINKTHEMILIKLEADYRNQRAKYERAIELLTTGSM